MAAGPARGAWTNAASGSASRTRFRRRGRTRTRKRSFWRELPVLILVALVIALLVKTFVVQAFYIPSGSMQNTLRIYDKVLVSKIVYDLRPIQPGDIVVFDGAGSWNAPSASPASGDPLVRLYDATLRPLLDAVGGLFGTEPGQTDYIKRVIGVPGDHVACCNAQGLVTINGVALHEKSYLYPGNTPGDAPAGESGRFRLTVPAGRLWVLGDHRAISDDSRGHEVDPGNGTIPESAGHRAGVRYRLAARSLAGALHTGDLPSAGNRPHAHGQRGAQGCAPGSAGPATALGPAATCG